jgi:nucleoside phosphorylase
MTTHLVGTESIAAGNELTKSAAERDRMGEEFGALCVEMETARLMIEFPCIVIRGTCDYADSHKKDGWQKYAALVAAAASIVCRASKLG